MEQVILLVLRSPTARRWIIMAIAALVVSLFALMLIFISLLGGSASSTVAASAEKEGCNTIYSSDEVYASDGPVRLPVAGKYTVTSPFGMRTQPMMGVYRLHAGVDLAMTPTGGAVLAPMDGTVESVNHNLPGTGNFIVLNHGKGLSTRYLHLASMNVKPGQKIEVGQKIGVEGNTTGGTGISTGAHLHFEVLENGSAVDPVPWMKKKGITIPEVGGSATAGKASKKKDSTSSGSSSSKSKESASTKPAAASSSDFDLPKPGSERKHTPGTKPLPIPAEMKKAYKAAGKKYGVPWQLLAGHGMEETQHGRLKAVSSAGAMGPMQFTPPTWTDYAKDGNGDGKADILNVDDSVHSAANMLAQSGVKSGPEGVKNAIHRYNQAEWYVNDVLWYAHQYANGKVSVSADGSSSGVGNGCSDSPGEDGAEIAQVDAPGSRREGGDQ